MVNGHNMSPEEQKEYYGSKDANSRNWNSLSPDAQEDARELWDLLYHHYSLAEFYDDLEEHPWSSGYNSSAAIDKIIEYKGVELIHHLPPRHHTLHLLVFQVSLYHLHQHYLVLKILPKLYNLNRDFQIQARYT